MKNPLMLAAVIVTAFMAAGSVAQAQDYTCIIINGQKCYVYVLEDGTLDTVCDEGSSGSGTFTAVEQPIPDDGPINTELTAQSLSTTIRDERYGAITTTLDPDRQATNTTIRSVKDERFPLDVRIRFFATAQLESQPDRVYESRTELEFGNDDVNSVNPFRDVTLTLTNDVEFYDRERPDEGAVFTLQAGSTTVTLGGEEAPNGDEGLR